MSFFIVFFIRKKDISPKLNKIFTGFAAGVMFSASFASFDLLSKDEILAVKFFFSLSLRNFIDDIADFKAEQEFAIASLVKSLSILYMARFA